MAVGISASFTEQSFRWVGKKKKLLRTFILLFPFFTRLARNGKRFYINNKIQRHRAAFRSTAADAGGKHHVCRRVFVPANKTRRSSRVTRRVNSTSPIHAYINRTRRNALPVSAVHQTYGPCRARGLLLPAFDFETLISVTAVSIARLRAAHKNTEPKGAI